MHQLVMGWALLFFGGWASPILAQQPIIRAGVDSVRQTLPRAPIDTSQLVYTLADAPELALPDVDTLADARFRQYDPARRRLIDWGTLGNIGSPARPLLFEPATVRGFHTGLQPFALYNISAPELRFYRHGRSFSEVFFSQGRNQLEAMTGARFSRTFAGGMNFSLDYRSINQAGQFRYQRAKHTALALGVWLPVGERYEAFLTYSTNTNRHQENGGITTDTLFGQGGAFSGPLDAPVWLTDQRAFTRHYDWTVQLHQHLRLLGKADKPGRTLRVSHRASYGRQVLKFSDHNLQRDTAFFGDFLIDRRGLRHYISYDRLDNEVTAATFKSKQPGRPSDVLSVGLQHSFFWLNQEPSDSVVSNLFLTGKLALTPSERFRFTAQGALGLPGNFGEYQVSGELFLGLGKAGALRAGLLAQRHPPALLHHRLFVSRRQLWKNDFEKPVANSLWGAYALPWLGLELQARIHQVNGYLYFDQNGLATQTTAPLQVVQFVVQENIRLGAFHFDNTFALQQSNRDDVLRLPVWFAKNSIYYDGRLFKKNLKLSLGFDFRIHGEFRPDTYQPLLAQFHLQDSIAQQPYPWLDVFAAFKVRTFRFFFRYENLGTFLDDSQVYYQTARYPATFAAFRFGINWRFMDDNKSQAGQ